MVKIASINHECISLDTQLMAKSKFDGLFDLSEYLWTQDFKSIQY